MTFSESSNFSEALVRKGLGPWTNHGAGILHSELSSIHALNQSKHISRPWVKFTKLKSHYAQNSA